MFGFGKKKETSSTSSKATDRAKRSDDFEQRKAQNKAQLGMFMGFDDGGVSSGGHGASFDFDVDDAELENELLMLLGDSDNNKSIGKKGGRATAVKNVAIPHADVKLDDVGDTVGDDEQEDDDDELDLDDPDLQAELGEILGGDPITPENDDSPSPPPPPKSTMSSVDLIKLLQERLQLYETAKVAADKIGDSSKSRRFTRGIRSLKELQGKAKSGRVVDEADIPPAVSISIGVSIKTTTTTIVDERPEIDIESPTSEKRDLFAPSLSSLHQQLPEPLQPTSVQVPPVPPPRKPAVKTPEPQIEEPLIDYFEPNGNDNSVGVIVFNEAGLERLKEYKIVAVILKRNGDVAGALDFLKLSKTLETALNAGEPVDLVERFPPVPGSSDGGSVVKDTGHEHQFVSSVVEEQHQSHSEQDQQMPSSEVSSGGGGGEDIFHAPPPPNSVMEALQQRLDKYKSEVDKANESSNSGKARRMGRIVKQYEEAITLYKKGKPVPYEDLPTPPGFGPIPILVGATGPAISHKIQIQVLPEPQPPKNNIDDSVSPEKRVKPTPEQPGPSSGGLKPTGTSTSSINRGGVGGKTMTKLTLQEKQLQEVLFRQKQYRDAAIEAKKRGDINQAREYLRASKGFDNLIEASKSGLPVDLRTLPSPPEALASLEAEDFELVSDQDCIIPSSSGGGVNLPEVFTKLEEDLRNQLKMCMRMREHFKAVGDVGSANKFEALAIETKRDLDALRLSAKSGTTTAKYHYENRIFSITECNTDIKDDEIEITVVRGINYKSTNSIDTFVRVELPYPSQEEAQSQKSHVVKDSIDPEYNVTYKMNINRGARNFQRFLQRHGVKIEVWSKGGFCSCIGRLFCCCNSGSGFLRSSSIFGVATAKLQPLGNKTTLHDAFEIMDGRKIVGKIEVKVRLRDPILTKQITQKKEKWLIIDRA